MCEMAAVQQSETLKGVWILSVCTVLRLGVEQTLILRLFTTPVDLHSRVLHTSSARVSHVWNETLGGSTNATT